MALRYCRLCGAQYNCCASCEKLRSWRTVADTAEHYYILGVLMDYKANKDADSAYRALRQRGVEVRNAKEFLPGAKMLTEEIFQNAEAESVLGKQIENTMQEE